MKMLSLKEGKKQTSSLAFREKQGISFSLFFFASYQRLVSCWPILSNSVLEKCGMAQFEMTGGYRE
jgi:hypothetical protein